MEGWLVGIQSTCPAAAIERSGWKVRIGLRFRSGWQSGRQSLGVWLQYWGRREDLVVHGWSTITFCFQGGKIGLFQTRIRTIHLGARPDFPIL